MSKENNIIRDKAFAFAFRIKKLSNYLNNDKKESVYSDQILRSGSSVGANVEEAIASLSKAEFSSKMSIAYKEAKETQYWIKLLFASKYLNEKEFNSISIDCEEICKILFSILKTSGRIRKKDKVKE